MLNFLDANCVVTECKLQKFVYNRGFGFMFTPNLPGVTIFFHFSKMVVPVFTGGDEPSKRGIGELIHDNINHFFDGNVGVVGLQKAEKGHVVTGSMVNIDHLRKVLDQIENRPIYRLLERTGEHERGKLETGKEYKFREIIQSKNLDKLRTQIKYAPPVSNPYRVKSGMISFFQILNTETGNWEYCEDPRFV